MKRKNICNIKMVVLNTIIAMLVIGCAREISTRGWRYISCSNFSNNRAVIETNHGWSVVDSKGENIALLGHSTDWQVIEDVTEFSDDMAAIKVGERWGFLDKNGEIKINPQFKMVKDFSQNLAAVKITKSFNPRAAKIMGYLADLWGYINKNGEFEIEPIYDNASSFSEGLAAVFYKKWGYINKKGERIIELKYDRAKPFSEGLAAVRINNEWGFIDKKGIPVVDLQYQNASSYSEGLAAVQHNGMWGFIDNKGKIVVETKYQHVKDFHYGLAPVMLDGKFGYIDAKGNIVIEFNYDIASSFSEGLAIVEEDDVQKIIDKKGNPVMSINNAKWSVLKTTTKEASLYMNDQFSEGYVPISMFSIKQPQFSCYYLNKVGEIEIFAPFFNDVGDFSEGLAKIELGNEKGYVSQNGKISILPQFEDSKKFSEGLAAVKQNGKWGFINKDGEVVIEPQHLDVQEVFSEGMIGIQAEDYYWGFIDLNGDNLITPSFDAVSDFHEGLVAVYKNEEWYFINKKGEELSSKRYMNYFPTEEMCQAYFGKGDHYCEVYWAGVGGFYSGMAPVHESNLWGYIGRDGMIGIQPKYSYAEEFSDGLALVLFNGKFGYISDQGRLEIPFSYNDARSFSDGLAAVKEGESWGYIDEKGSMVIKLKHNIFSPGNFIEGVAKINIKTKGWPCYKTAYIDKTGKKVINTLFNDGRDFIENHAAVQLDDGLWTFIDMKENILGKYPVTLVHYEK